MLPVDSVLPCGDKKDEQLPHGWLFFGEGFLMVPSMVSKESGRTRGPTTSYFFPLFRPRWSENVSP